jgi:DMSO/TMAO reductase YedYZ heme-binding membrane subunit
MNFSWVSARGAGIAAYSLLAAATMWGLLLSSKALAGRISTKNLTFVHEALSIGGLVATIIHVVALLTDQYVGFTLTDVLVPGSTSWRPLAVAFGIIAFYGMILTSSTFYMRRRIGQSTWRAIHFLTYGVFTAALLHGIQAGTDSHGVLAVGLYGGTGMVVLALTAIRVASHGEDRPRPTRAAAAGSSTARSAARSAMARSTATRTASTSTDSERRPTTAHLGSDPWNGSSTTGSAATRPARSPDR